MTTFVPTFHRNPDVERGVNYWQSVPATVDGVLGGFGNGTLPIVDAQGSRTFLLEMLPRLSAIAPASASSSSDNAVSNWLAERIKERGGPGRAVTRALDCGAGVGRVTRDVLSRLVDIVHIVEPVESFLDAAKKQSSSWPSMNLPPSKTAFKARKAVHFRLSTLQAFDPAKPYSSSISSNSKLSTKRVKLQAGSTESLYEPTLSIGDEGEDATSSPGALEAVSKQEPIEYDVIWGQWCLQHLSDKDLIAFLERAKACLRKPTTSNKESSTNAILDGSGIIVVKENVLRATEDGSEEVWYDDQDHSITRTPNAYERVFRQAGLEVVKTQLQLGLPEELLPVQIWCLRIPSST
ncbi:DUF858-domain-containing protein [Meira miltonrushii]|uniref:Alpha N-terminal protein methyltransferase 1 n=1 Tax=Meira miltonrushii TaxID=1280837 RepID=A0A316VMA0_9BASI|nr:DUF858-domain-containing protein [Meira miltonrushii]PWN38414.1 DUF858-domain-containing protein [Meira miltonrushii]